MKQKEIKNLAKKIAQQEQILQKPDLTPEEQAKAENAILELSSRVKTIEDMIAVDEAVQDFLANS